MTSIQWTFKRGFWCSDNTISYPILINSNITHLFLLIINLLVPIILIVIIQFVTFITTFDKMILFKFFITLYQIILTFLNGLLITILLTYVLKIFTGRLTPYFIHICQPDIDCSLEKNQNVYHLNYTCFIYDSHSLSYNLLQESRLSFVSSHSSMTTYSMFFLIQFFQLKFGGSVKSKSFLVLIQLIPLVVTMYVCIYVINYHLHHWEDVISGVLLGLLVSFKFRYRNKTCPEVVIQPPSVSPRPSIGGWSYANSERLNSI